MASSPDQELMVGRLVSEISQHYDLRSMQRDMCGCGWVSPRDVRVTWAEHLAEVLVYRKPWLSR